MFAMIFGEKKFHPSSDGLYEGLKMGQFTPIPHIYIYIFYSKQETFFEDCDLRFSLFLHELFNEIICF